MACAAAATAPTIREADDRFRLLRMECECERPRKRPKLSGWDVPVNSNANSNEKAKAQLFSWQGDDANADGNGIGVSFSSSSSSSGRELQSHHNNLTASLNNVKTKGLAAASSPPWRHDDKDGHYVFALGDNLTHRYKILSKMGQDMHDLHLVHTDLKPENILFASSDYVKVPDNKGIKCSPTGETYVKRLPKSSAIKLIDFGSTTFENQDHTSVISTRQYRAPEVILGLGWNYPCDIWSVGCILVELCSGETLFQTHENLEHLAMMERVLGPLPIHMIKRADRRSSKYFRHRTKLDWPEGASSRESVRAVRRLLHLQDLIMQHVDKSASVFIDLLKGLLKFEPSERMKAREALRHPFFTGSNKS